MKQLMHFVREERGSVSVLEYSIVLPICFIMIASLLALGFVMHRRAVMDTAAAEAVNIAAKAYTATYITADGDPYKYLKGGYHKTSVHTQMVDSVRERLGNSASVDIADSGIGTERRVKIVVRQPYGLFSMESSFERTLICAAADVRNADFFMFLARRYTGADLESHFSDITKKLQHGIF